MVRVYLPYTNKQRVKIMCNCNPQAYYWLESVNGIQGIHKCQSTKAAKMLATKLANKTGNTVKVRFGFTAESSKVLATSWPATEYN